MEKKIFQDVLPPSKKSIRSIPLPTDRYSVKGVENNTEIKPDAGVYPSRRSLGKMVKYFIAFLILIGALVSVFALMSLFSSSEITIYPKTLKAPISTVLESFKDDQSAPLFHTIIVSSTTKVASIDSDKEKEFNERASGIITIYNDYSKESQRLIRNTRFETSSGLIYRIDQSVVVPGQTEVNGVKIPGSVDALVYADVAGEEYNLNIGGTGKLSVPGFKETPRFDYFYAELKTDIKGGFSGTKKYLEDSDSAPIRGRLQTEIEGTLKASILAGIPSGYILIPGGFFMEYENLIDTVSGDKVNVGVLGTAYVVAINKVLFSKAVAVSNLEGYNNKDLEIKNIDNMNISVDNKTGRPWMDESIIVDVQGEAEFVWLIDSGSLVNAITGKPKNQIKDILGGYEEVERAEVKLKPFWLSNFPSDPKKIKLGVVLDSN